MDAKRTGEFLSALRKAQGYTQQEVAARLGVADKTVSKWECGNGYPDVTILPAIAALFDVSVDELLEGGRRAVKAREDAPERRGELAAAMIRRKRRETVPLIYSAMACAVAGMLLHWMLSMYMLAWALTCVCAIGCAVAFTLLFIALERARFISEEAWIAKAAHAEAEGYIKRTAKNAGAVTGLCVLALVYALGYLSITQRTGGLSTALIRANPIPLLCGAILGVAAWILSRGWFEDRLRRKQ